MSKRSHNEGSIYQDKTSGRWIAEISGGYGDNGKRRRIKRKCRTKTEAVTKLKELRRQLDDGVPTGKANMTVADLLNFYRETVLPSKDLSPNTLDNYNWSIDGHLKPGLGRKRITALTAEDVERFLVRRRDERDLSKNSLIRLKTHLAVAIKEAQRRDWIHRNVAELARVPKSHTTIRRSLTQEQAQALLEAARGDRLEAAILIGLTRGLRPGEIFGLKWEDLDLQAEPPVMHVRHSIKKENNKLRLGDTKTTKSRRSLVIPAPALEALQRHRSIQNRERLANGDVWHDLDLVFCTEIGTLVDPSNFRRELQKLTDKAGLESFTPYELRHSAVSLLSAAGVPIEQLVDLAGHTDARTLMQVYRHQISPAVDAGSALADSMFSNAAAPLPVPNGPT